MPGTLAPMPESSGTPSDDAMESDDDELESNDDAPDNDDEDQQVEEKRDE